MAERKSLLKTIEVRVLDEPMRLFRIVPERPSPSFENAFRSHYELGRPPRGPENRAAAIHMAISMFDRRQVAEDLAARVPKLGGTSRRLSSSPPSESASRRPRDPPIGRSGAVQINS